MLNCPFCHKQPTLVKRNRIRWERGKNIHYKTYQYRCYKCGVETPLDYRTLEDAQRVWNMCADAECFDFIFPNHEGVTYNAHVYNLEFLVRGNHVY